MTEYWGIAVKVLVVSQRIRCQETVNIPVRSWSSVLLDDVVASGTDQYKFQLWLQALISTILNDCFPHSASELYNVTLLW